MTYVFMKKLSDSMEKFVLGVSRINMKEQRQLRMDTNSTEAPKNIIDGDFLEQFIDLPEDLQKQIAEHTLANKYDMSMAYLLEVK